MSINFQIDANSGTEKAPKLVMPNFIEDLIELRDFARFHGFSGIDWSFDARQLPQTPADIAEWVKGQQSLAPLEIRYHCPFIKVDIGHEDSREQAAAVDLFKQIIYLVAAARGRFLTLHVGLGRDTTRILSWESTISNLKALVQLGNENGITVCLENLAWGWTSKPNLFEKLVRQSGAAVTFDIGHAHACDTVNSQQYSAKDFVTPHYHWVYNAHIYHTEIPGTGHVPPDEIEDINERLRILDRTPCNWWVLELRERKGLLQTKSVIDDYLTQNSIIKEGHIQMAH